MDNERLDPDDIDLSDVCERCRLVVSSDSEGTAFPEEPTKDE